MIVLYAYNEAMMSAPFEDTKFWKDWPELTKRANIQAERNLCFVDRYKGEEDPLGYIAPRWPAEPLIMGNLSAWTSRRGLYDYTFGAGTHGGMVKHRSRWFEPWPHTRPHFVMWWGQAEITADDDIICDFDLDTAMLMQAELGRTGPTSQYFGWKQ
jgi:hypothetical protein